VSSDKGRFFIKKTKRERGNAMAEVNSKGMFALQRHGNRRSALRLAEKPSIFVN
jgi:hypothetical protein